MREFESLALLVRDNRPEDLLVRSTECLQRGDRRAAFMVSDRLCRIASPSPQALMMRGQALSLLGHADAAERDFGSAYALDPTDVLACRRRLSHGGGAAREAAGTLLGDPRLDAETLAKVLAILLDDGHDVVATLRVESGALSGAVAIGPQGFWRMSVTTDRGTMHVPLPRQGREGGPASPFRLDLVLPGAFQSLDFTCGAVVSGAVLALIRRNPDPASAAPARPGRDWTVRGTVKAVTIVLPVYDDVPITRACLDSVARQRAPATEIRVIVVDDASPAEGMRAMLEGWCRDQGAELIVNDRNLGFIGAVNRALARIVDGDLLLLNSDVILPDGAVERLAAAARIRPGIGIVNPLTNNAPFSGYPSLYGESPLEPLERIALIDQAAAKVNAGVVVGLPSAVGFCMLITRACLDAVGGLSDVYLRGYYEDAEFCLRAAQRGFESVCAPNVYVGHKGSSSFKGEKRALVMRNGAVLAGRFPDHEAETRAFLRADPLASARTAIEAEMGPSEAIDVVIAGSATYADVMRERAGVLRDEGTSSILLSWSVENGVACAAFGGLDGAPAGAARFPATDPQPNAALLDWLDRLAPLRVELAGSGGAFEPTFDAVRHSGVAFGFLVSESLGRAQGARHACRAADDPEPCPDCVAAFDAAWMPQGIGLQCARSVHEPGLPLPSVIVSTDPMSRQVVADLAGDAFAASAIVHSEPAAPIRTVLAGRRPVLALLYRHADPDAEAFMVRLARIARDRQAAIDLLVVGGDEAGEGLLSCGNLFVTGPVADRDCPELLAQYEAAALCAPQRWSGFGRLARHAAALDLPKVYFDWSIGAALAATPDLALDPRLCDAKAAGLVIDWTLRVIDGAAR